MEAHHLNTRGLVPFSGCDHRLAAIKVLPLEPSGKAEEDYHIHLEVQFIM
jgi:hypothetical protein